MCEVQSHSCVENAHGHLKQKADLNRTHGWNILNLENDLTLVKSATNALRAAAPLSTIGVRTQANVRTVAQPVARSSCVQMRCTNTLHLILVSVDISALSVAGSLQPEVRLTSTSSHIRRQKKKKQLSAVMYVIKAFSLKHNFHYILLCTMAVDLYGVMFVVNLSATRTVLQNI